MVPPAAVTAFDVPEAHDRVLPATARYRPPPRWSVPWKRPEWLLFTVAIETHLRPSRIWSRMPRLRAQPAFGELTRPLKLVWEAN